MKMKSMHRALLLSVLLFPASLWQGVSDQVRGFTVYGVTPFQRATYQYVPSQEERIDKIALAAAPGEYEPATFSIYARRDLMDVSVDAGELRCGKRVIPRLNIDVRVVKVRRQPGDNVPFEPEHEMEAPELLVYDDFAVLKGRRPSVGEVPVVKTSIAQGTSKQFWVTVNVPAAAAAGVYTGALDVYIGGKKAAGIPLEVEVLPFQLVRPRQDFLIYYRANLEPKSGPEYETWTDFVKQLRNIKEHGFTGASIFSSEQHLPAILKEYEAIGFSSPIPYLGRTKGVAEVEQIVRDSGPLRLVYYGIDEPNNPASAEACRKLFREIKAGGGTTVTAVMKQYADVIWDSIDIPNYSMCDPGIDGYIKGLSEGRLKKNPKREWYYWQIMKERPKTARLMCGFYLWKSKLDGIFPYCYQMINTADPYDDFTPWEWRGYKWRPHLVTYPSKEGPIDTLQWEACREGIDDMKYVATLEDTVRRMKNMRSFLRLRGMGMVGEDPRLARLDRLIADSEKVLKEVDARIDPDCLKALEKLKEKDLIEFRERITREISRGVEELKE
jgi:hypothetical protein